jgi:perosamine synthetase
MLPQIQPWIDDDEVEAVAEAVGTTFLTEHDRTRQFEARLCELTGASHAIAYCNATCAIFALLRAKGIGPGDEVVVPDMTFIATANAVILAGATPVFCDVDSRSLMMTPELAERCITPRTKAIIPVHLYGMAAPLRELSDLACRRGLHLIEDAAQAIGVRYRGRHVGTADVGGVISFYGNKTITTGEGGAILTNDSEIAAACFRIKNHGRSEKGVFVHDEIGFNFSFTEMQAAVGIAQLDKLSRIIADKLRIRRHYETRLKDVAGIRFQEVPAGVEPVFWFTNIFHDDVPGLIDALRAAGIGSRRFFYPLHLQPCYRSMKPAPCPTSKRLYETGLSLPSACHLDERTLDRICDVVANFEALV